MGIWGTKLYQDDLALDIKEDYKENLKKGMSNKEALKAIKENYRESIKDGDEAPIFWMALADTMWNLGRLTKEVKNKAIQEIKKGNNLKKWEEEGTRREYEKRKNELEKLRERLNSPMPEEKKISVKRNTPKKGKIDWNIGDTYAYKLKSDRARELGLEGKYIILRKVDNSNMTGRICAIVYCQICNGELPKNHKELEKLEYVIFDNEGNVRYDYKLEINSITQKALKDDFVYIGNFINVALPPKIYEQPYKDNICYCFYKDMEEKILFNMSILGTSKHPKYCNQKPENIMDSQIRFLMREKYYEETLGIEPKKGSYINEDSILYISLIDSMMIGGWVQNPTGPLTEEMKEEAYKKIKKLKDIVMIQKEGKEEKIKILEKLENRIREYKEESPLEDFMKKLDKK